MTGTSTRPNTGISVSSLGMAIAEFAPHRGERAVAAGVILLAAGLLVAAYGTWRYRDVDPQLDAGLFTPPGFTAIVTAGTITFLAPGRPSRPGPTARRARRRVELQQPYHQRTSRIMKYRLRPEDLAFLENAPFRQTCTGELQAPVGAVFDQIAAHPENWPRWFTPADDVRYEGPPPHGVGSMRFFRLYRLVRAREQIIAWDPDERFAYQVHEANVPGVRALMEQWTLTPLTDTTTDIHWTLAVDARPFTHLLLQASRRHIDKLFNDSARRLEGLCLAGAGGQVR